MVAHMSTSILILYSSSTKITISKLTKGKELLLAIGIGFLFVKLMLEIVSYIAKNRGRLSEV